VNIRKVAIGFALLSTLYWMVVQGVWSYAIDGPGAEPMWQQWLFGAVPPMIYAVLCLIFCHRLARAMGLAARRDMFE